MHSPFVHINICCPPSRLILLCAYEVRTHTQNIAQHKRIKLKRNLPSRPITGIICFYNWYKQHHHQQYCVKYKVMPWQPATTTSTSTTASLAPWESPIHFMYSCFLLLLLNSLAAAAAAVRINGIICLSREKCQVNYGVRMSTLAGRCGPTMRSVCSLIELNHARTLQIISGSNGSDCIFNCPYMAASANGTIGIQTDYTHIIKQSKRKNNVRLNIFQTEKKATKKTRNRDVAR